MGEVAGHVHRTVGRYGGEVQRTPLMVKCLARVSVALLTVLVERRRIVPEVKFISPVTDIAEVPLPFFMLKVPPARLKFPATEMVEVPELFTAVKVPALSLKFAPTVIVRLFEELVRNRGAGACAGNVQVAGGGEVGAHLHVGDERTVKRKMPERLTGPEG